MINNVLNRMYIILDMHENGNVDFIITAPGLCVKTNKKTAQKEIELYDLTIQEKILRNKVYRVVYGLQPKEELDPGVRKTIKNLD